LRSSAVRRAGAIAFALVKALEEPDLVVDLVDVGFDAGFEAGFTAGFFEAGFSAALAPNFLFPGPDWAALELEDVDGRQG